MNVIRWKTSLNICFMLNIMAKSTYYAIRTLRSWKSGYRTKFVFLQLWNSPHWKSIRVCFEDVVNRGHWQGISSFQNPNLTTTQPQPNLNLVGFDTIITLHHPPPTHPTHRNSTSTRNNDPRGLKFCRRPNQAKLTTIQHNSNPTIFWGGGGHISSTLG